MKHKTWFRLVLKAIGIFLLATGAVSVVDSVSSTMGMAAFSGRFGPAGSGSFFDIQQVLLWALYHGLIGGLASLVIGAYMLFGGAKLVNLCIPSNRPYCPHCGYDLRAVSDELCPECGLRLPADLFAAQGAAGADLTDLDDEPLPKRTGFTRFVPPRNGRALIGYYFAIASLIPIFGGRAGSDRSIQRPGGAEPRPAIPEARRAGARNRCGDDRLADVRFESPRLVPLADHDPVLGWARLSNCDDFHGRAEPRSLKMASRDQSIEPSRRHREIATRRIHPDSFSAYLGLAEVRG